MTRDVTRDVTGEPRGPAEEAGEDVDSLFLSFCLSDSDRGRALLAAALLDHQDLPALLTERRHAADSRSHVFRLLRYRVMRRIERSEDWIGTAVGCLVDLDASWSESAEFCNKLTRWSWRQLNTARPYLNPAEILNAGAVTVADRARLHLYATALRYEFRTRNLEHVLESFGTPVSSLDPYVHALYAFALLAQNDPQGVEEMNAVLARGGGDDISVLHALQEGLRYGDEIPDQAELMLALWRRPAFNDKRDETVLLREAYALRRLGRYEEALATVERSLLMLPPNEVDRHERRMSERWRIVEQRELSQRSGREYARAQQAAREEIDAITRQTLARLDEQVAGVRAQVSDNLLRIVEILGIFTAVIALVVGGASAGNAGAGITWWQRALLILTSGVVAIGFFVLLRFVVRPGAEPPGPGVGFGTGDRVSRGSSTSGRGWRT